MPHAQAETDEKSLPYNVGQWLPSDQQVLEDWRAKLIRETDALAENAPLLPVIQEFKELIETDPDLRRIKRAVLVQTNPDTVSQIDAARAVLSVLAGSLELDVYAAFSE